MQRLKRRLGWVRGFRPIPTPAIKAPLLDGQAIGELALRLQRPAPSPGQLDVAHRRLGESRSIYRGSGMDYDESRHYLVGDDPRAMDWRLSARTGEPYVKLFREERRPATFIVVDRRRAMRFGTRTRLKITQAARAATLAAFDANRRQSAVAGVLLESEPLWLAEAAGDYAAFRFATEAARPAPPFAHTSEPSLQTLLSQLVPSLLPGTTVWLISDFHDLTAASSGLLLQLAGEHQLYAVQVVDPAEEILPDAGPLQLFPPSGTAAAAVDSGDAATREAYAEVAAAHHDERKALFTSLNIPFVRLAGDTEALERELPL